MNRYSFVIVVCLFFIATGFIPGKIAFIPSIGNHNNSNSQLSLKWNEMIHDTTKKWDLVVTRIFNAPVASVWKAWSNPEFVMKWWGPTGFSSPTCKMNFKEGGTTLVCMRAPKEFGGQDMYNTWAYKKIVLHEFIEYIFDWADKDGNRIDPESIGLPPGMPRDARHTVVFKDLGNGNTEMIMTEFGYISDQLYDLSKAGLEQCLDKMAAIFAKN